jgi:transcriptional regulator with XRE-family HTH domain
MDAETPTLAVDMPLTLDQIARTQIRRWIQSTGITQTALAERIGRNQAWMSRYLGGEFDADLVTLNQIATVFDHTITALLQVPEDPDIARLVMNYRALRPEARAILLGVAEEMSRATRTPGRSRK